MVWKFLPITKKRFVQTKGTSFVTISNFPISKKFLGLSIKSVKLQQVPYGIYLSIPLPINRPWPHVLCRKLAHIMSFLLSNSFWSNITPFQECSTKAPNMERYNLFLCFGTEAIVCSKIQAPNSALEKSIFRRYFLKENSGYHSREKLLLPILHPFVKFIGFRVFGH